MSGNPEVLLRKRRNADRLRIKKREQAKSKALEMKRRQSSRKGKFLRAETLVAQHRATKRENDRVKKVVRYNGLLQGSEEAGDDEEKLAFVVRVNGPRRALVPAQAQQILDILRLKRPNTATFIKYNASVRPLLRLVNPYVVLGTPSLATVRNLIQKRARVRVTMDEKEEEERDDVEEIENENEDNMVSVPLNDNNLIEERLGEYGVICTEDIIHEVATLGENFKVCVRFMEPFELKDPVNGWGPLDKLKRLELKEEEDKMRVANSGRAPLREVDIDKFIEELN